MVLYVCPFGTIGGELPGPLAHPCGKAAKARDDAGHRYEITQVKGGLLRFWTWPTRARDRADIRRLSGRNGVPILVLDDAQVVAGSGEIVRWASEHPPASGEA